MNQGANPKVTGAIAALIVIYHMLIGMGVKLPALPPGFEGALVTVVLFIMGMFTRTPAGKTSDKISETAARLTGG